MYFPKSQIKTNIYTNGNEYVLSTTKQPYKGYYYLTSSGKTYAGKKPTSSPSIEIILSSKVLNYNPQSPNIDGLSFSLNGDNIALNRMSISSGEPQLLEPQLLKNTPLGVNNISSYSPSSQVYLNRYIPTFSPVYPTNQDFENGSFKRYFCKKNNELKYIEIDQYFYTKLLNQDKDVAWDLYSPACIQWQLTGESSQVYNSNLALANNIENTDNWVGFSQYFKNNFTKYYGNLNNLTSTNNSSRGSNSMGNNSGGSSY